MRDAMYRSELAAEKTKIRTQALKMEGRYWMPLILMATTKGEAAALLDLELLSIKSLEL